MNNQSKLLFQFLISLFVKQIYLLKHFVLVGMDFLRKNFLLLLRYACHFFYISVILIIARDIIDVRMVLIKDLNVQEVLHGMKKQNHVHGLSKLIVNKRN
jgi:hypothetical protein